MNSTDVQKLPTSALLRALIYNQTHQGVTLEREQVVEAEIDRRFPLLREVIVSREDCDIEVKR